MKNIFRVFLLISLGIFTSCEEELDINTDPNSPGEINTGLALASAEASLMTVMGGELTNYGGFFAQYHTQSPSASQYENIDQYNLTTNYADRLWTELYAGCLNDLKYVEEQSIADEDHATALIATVLKAYTFQVLVDLFNDVPYTEALQGEANITPNPTPGMEIYLDLLTKIDAALAAHNADPADAASVGSQDLVYGGSMSDWVKFANSLKLKIYLRMAYTSSANPAAVNALLAENNFIDSDAKFGNFGDALNQRNPFYEVQIVRLGDVNNIASNSLRLFYVENDDPRMEFVYRRNSANAHASLPQGAGPEFSNLGSNYSRPRVNPNTPVYLMSFAESNFLQAEGLVRYSGGAGAQGKYDDGVIASFATYQSDFQAYNPDTKAYTPIMTSGAANAAALALIAPGGAYEYVPGGVEASVRQIIVQKWASLAYINNIEAYFETVRTKYPEVVTEGTEDYAIGNRIPSRISIRDDNVTPSILFYPDDEVNRNPNINQHETLFDKVWWDQK